MSQQDSAFYTTSDSWELVWTEDCEKPQNEADKLAYVVVCGRMKLRARNKPTDEWTTIYTAFDLAKFGITTDEQLQELEQRGSEYCDWANNSWFEVWQESVTDQDTFLDNVYHTVDEAIAEAKRINEGVRSGNK